MSSRTHARLLLVPLLFLLALPAVDAEAQQPPVSELEMTTYAQVFLAIAELQEAGQKELARTHDEQARAAAQMQMEREIDEVFEEQGMTRRRYAAISFWTSSDPATESLFRRILAAVQEPPRLNGGELSGSCD